MSEGGLCGCQNTADSYLTSCAELSPPRDRRSWWDRWGVCTAKGRASPAGSSPTQELSPTFSGSCDHWQQTRPPALALAGGLYVYFEFKYLYWQDLKRHRWTMDKCSCLKFKTKVYRLAKQFKNESYITLKPIFHLCKQRTFFLFSLLFCYCSPQNQIQTK